MARIPNSFIDELLSRTNLEELVGEYIPLTRRGKNYWGCCPFHNEKTPSFKVDVEKQLYYCFGCHASGTAYRFIQEKEHLEFPDAVRFLAERAHMDVPEEQGRGGESGRAATALRERICEANKAAARFFHEQLWTPEGAEALDYLYRRGLNDADIRRFGLGAAPRGGDELLRYLRARGFDDALLRAAGLAVERDGRLRDMFRGRVIFPIIRHPKRVLGFGGRAMGDAKPKYLNTPETPAFNKRLELYALNFAREERDAGHLVLVEGYMDAVSLRKYGVRGVVATLGTALTQEQARLIRRHVPEVWISYDGDAAGQKAALRALDIFEEIDGLTAKVIDYPAGQDPDDFIKANGLAGFEKLPRYDAAEYRLLRARDDLDLRTQDGMTQYAMRGCEILRRVKDPVYMENYLRKLAAETGYERETLLRQIGVAAPEPERLHRPRRGAPQPQEGEAVLVEERAVLTLLAEGLIPREMVAEEDFSREISRRVARWLLEGRGIAGLLERIEDDGERDAVAWAVNYVPIPESREDCLRLAETSLASLRRRRLSARLREIEAELPGADPARKAELYGQIQRITKEIEDVDRSKGVSHL